MSAIEIQMTDRIGDLTPAQIDHLARGLEHAHELTLEDAGGGHYWLQSLDGGAILMRSHRTVEHVWKCAEAISAAVGGMSDTPRAEAPLEPDGGNLYEAHPLMVNSGRFWRCKHGVTGLDGNFKWLGCDECRRLNPVKAAAWESQTHEKPA